MNTNEFYEISQYQKTEEYLDKYKKELPSKERMRNLKDIMDYKLAAIAVNIKRIASIASIATLKFCVFSLKKRIFNRNLNYC